VSNVNFRFDFYDLPLDVIWLDIDATHDYEYFTWNPNRFPNASLEVML
jgi:mannosyl-oligosaccharide alpha-1,3-glucosidase